MVLKTRRVKGPRVEVKSHVDFGWYDGNITLENDEDDLENNRVRVHFTNFDESDDEFWDNETLTSEAEIRKRVRLLSAQLQDKDCFKVAKGMIVCANYRTTAECKYFDATVTSVVRKTHEKYSRREICRCEFNILWEEGPLINTSSTVRCPDISLIVERDVIYHPLVRSLLEFARERTHLVTPVVSEQGLVQAQTSVSEPSVSGDSSAGFQLSQEPSVSSMSGDSSAEHQLSQEHAADLEWERSGEENHVSEEIRGRDTLEQFEPGKVQEEETPEEDEPENEMVQEQDIREMEKLDTENQEENGVEEEKPDAEDKFDADVYDWGEPLEVVEEEMLERKIIEEDLMEAENQEQKDMKEETLGTDKMLAEEESQDQEGPKEKAPKAEKKLDVDVDSLVVKLTEGEETQPQEGTEKKLEGEARFKVAVNWDEEILMERWEEEIMVEKLMGKSGTAYRACEDEVLDLPNDVLSVLRSFQAFQDYLSVKASELEDIESKLGGNAHHLERNAGKRPLTP